MHEQFSDRARHAMALATREAGRLQHDYIGPEHILLGLVTQGECVAGELLTAAGVDPARVREEIDRRVEAGQAGPVIGRRPYNPQTRAVMEHAISEARRLGHKYVGTEHLLLGLLHLDQALPAQVLRDLGVDLESLRQAVLQALQATGPGHDVAVRSFGELEWIHQQELAKAFQSTAFWHTLILAIDSANRLGQSEIGSEHLLLAILRRDSRLAKLMAEKGVTPDWVRRQLTRVD